jgi:hypothetical protein
MKMRMDKDSKNHGVAALTVVAALVAAAPQAHHSFAMYDQARRSEPWRKAEG